MKKGPEKRLVRTELEDTVIKVGITHLHEEGSRNALYVLN